MKKVLKIITISALSVALIYSIAWYSWGLMLRHSVVTTLHSSKLQKYIEFDKIELAGFPFTFKYRLFNLKLTNSSADNNIVVNLGNPVLSSDIFMQDFVMVLSDNPIINLSPNNQSFVLKYNEGAILNLVTKKSLILELFRKHALNDLNFSDIEKVGYVDYGYTINDLLLDKSIFVSKGSDVNLLQNNLDNKDLYTFYAQIHGEGSVDYSEALISLVDINLNSKLELGYKDQKKDTLESVSFLCDQCTWYSNNYKMSLSGDVCLENSTLTSHGELYFNIIGYNNFIRMLDVYTDQEQNKRRNLLLEKITGVSDNSSLNDLKIVIKGEGSNIKIGNANIIDLMLYYLNA